MLKNIFKILPILLYLSLNISGAGLISGTLVKTPMNSFDLSLSDQKRISEIGEMLRIDPLNVEILLKKAFVFHYGSFDEEAISIYKRILELDPINLKAYIWICEAIYMERDYKFLKKIAESALKIYPNKVEFYKYLLGKLSI